MSDGEGFFLGAVLGCIIGAFVGSIWTRSNYECSAVANNCGQYVLNQYGNVVFTWKKEKADE